MLLYIVLVLGFIKAILLYRGSHLLPHIELRRRARNNDKRASAIYKLTANQQGLDLLVLAAAIVCGMALIVLTSRTSWWAGSVTIALVMAAILWRPANKEKEMIISYAGWVAPYVYKLTKSVLPTLNRLAQLLKLPTEIKPQIGVYEKEDLVKLLKDQAVNSDNRIPEEDLEIAANSLTFGDKKVADIMTPRKTTRFVSESESIGPMLMDELHATGHRIFAVIKGGSKPTEPEVIGMLYLEDLIANPEKPKVKDVMHTGRSFIDENLDLRAALEEFIKTKKHFLVVINHFQEVVGTLSLMAVIEQIIGKKLPEDEI